MSPNVFGISEFAEGIRLERILRGNFAYSVLDDVRERSEWTEANMELFPKTLDKIFNERSEWILSNISVSSEVFEIHY